MHPLVHLWVETRRRLSKVYRKTPSQTVRNPDYACPQLFYLIAVPLSIDDDMDCKVADWMQLTRSPICRTNGLKQPYKQEEKGTYPFTELICRRYSVRASRSSSLMVFSARSWVTSSPVNYLRRAIRVVKSVLLMPVLK